MQKTERVGAVALLFLIVTIVAVALWDDGGTATVETARAEPGRAAVPEEQRAVRQRPQVQRQQRDRHEDGLRSTRAAARRDDQSLLAGAGEVAPVRARPVQAPLLVEQAQSAGGVAPHPGEVTGEAGPDPDLAQNGWGNGRKPRSEEIVLAAQEVPPSSRERVVRKRKDKAAESIETAGAQAISPGQTHVVKRSETLGGISQSRLGRASRWPEIALLNGIEGHEIRVGQILRLPSDASSSSEATASVVARVLPRDRNARPASTGRSYVIRKGDVLGTIAQHELGSSTRWREILSLNPGLDEKKLPVGSKILLPAGSRSTAAQKPLLASASTGSEFRVR